jgi:hypothetical protein
MAVRMTQTVRAITALFLLSLAAPALSQTFSIQSISTADLGKVQSATSGDTVFRIDSATGNVTRQSGTGIRVASAATRTLVTIACGAQNQCDTDSAKIVITKIGTPTKRAGALTNFNVSVSGATATLATTPTGTTTLTFNVGPIGKSSSKTFWLGMDYPIKDDSALATGDATSGFVVTISKTNGSSASASNGSVIARVFRPITIGLTSNMSFGTISRPFTGTGTYSLDSATGDRTLTGQGVQGLISAPVRAAYTVSGEGGQVFSVSVPATFDLTRTGGSITVTTNNTAGGTQVLGGALGSSGSFPFYVGGSFPLSSTMTLGAYTASFAVTVQYN